MIVHNNKHPLVSVLMGAYNEEDWLYRSVDSILSQTYKNIEFIIINDGSTDNTQKILEEYKKNDHRIKISNQKNIGLTKSLNIGIEFCNGKYIARMDADNIALKNRIREQVDFLDKHLNHALVGSLREDIYPNGKIIIFKLPIKNEDIKRNLIKSCVISHSSVMIRSSILKKYKYNENYMTSQDYELWTRIGKNYKLGNIDKVLSKAYYRENSITRTKSQIKRLYVHTIIKLKAFYNLKPPFYYIVYVLKPLIEYFIPQKILNIYITYKNDYHGKKNNSKYI